MTWLQKQEEEGISDVEEEEKRNMKEFGNLGTEMIFKPIIYGRIKKKTWVGAHFL
jgi:hypothetical protein